MIRKLLLLQCLFFVIFFQLGATEKTEQKELPKEELSETMHTIHIDGKAISYKATAGTMILKDDKDNPKASFFYVSYIKQGEEDNTRRPITFCFNGGPGSSAIWLHMGVFGPKRVAMLEENFIPPPYKIVDNEYCFLDVTDLVFIDPISTGYSRTVNGEDPKQYHGVEEDIKSVSQFIRLFTTRQNRWNSPKFIAGESYGTTRAAGLAGHLHDEYFYYLNGVILVSSVLNFQTLEANSGNDLPYILFLPSYTTAAWYHNKLPQDLQKDLFKTLDEVEAFAIKDYAQALMLGDLLDPKERTEIVNKLAKYTGLSKKYIEQSNLRVCQQRFNQELLKNEGKVIGRFDSRFLGINTDLCADSFQMDPSAEAIFGIYTPAFYQYIRNDLKWLKDEEYKVLANVFPWNFGKATNKYLNVADNLKDVMTKNPALKVFVASGYYDLATPYFATEYTFQHLGIDPSLKANITMGYYDAGHMMYTHKPSLEKMKKDIATFIHSAIPKK